MSKKLNFTLLLLVLFTIPTFLRMLRPGIYSMQDFHFFRLHEFDRCIRDLQIPCRWAPDAALGFGEPLFNFYSQLPYLVGEVFHFTGLSKIDSLKLLFISSLVGSALAMFFLAKQIWKNNQAAFVSSILYVWAPYRAVDVWVRGALPEALSFVLFPLIVYKLNKFIYKERFVDLLWLAFLLAALILTHNLSVLMFGVFLLVWIPYQLAVTRKWRLPGKIFAGAGLSLLLSAFYILPVLFESKYVTLEKTISGYFDFRGHFAGLFQLLFSRHWGYGASLFGPNDDLNISVGHLQWAVPLAGLVLAFVRRSKTLKNLLVLILVGWLVLFLTHNKSTFVWESVPPMAYLQFPWRFLGIAVFSFSLAAGATVVFFGSYGRWLAAGIVSVALLLNYSFFREDIWYGIGDGDMLSGGLWEEQRRASIGDYWPIFGEVPQEAAPENLGGARLVKRGSNSAVYRVDTNREQEVQFPIAYFPGWMARTDLKSYAAYPSGVNGLVTIKAPAVSDLVIKLEFKNTPVRLVGNVVSAVSFLAIVFLLVKRKFNAT